MGTLLTWSKVTSVISLSQGLIFHIGPLLGESNKLTLMMRPLLAGLWTTLVLEKNTVYYRSHSKYLFYKPAHAFFLAFDPTLALCPLNIHFPLIFSSPTTNTDDSIRNPHSCGSRPAVLQHSSRGHIQGQLCICCELKEFWLSMNSWGTKQGLSFAAEKGGILKLIYEQLQYPVGT